MTTSQLSHRVDVAADPVTREDLVGLATADGPYVSLLMPTPRMGPQTRRAGKQFARLCGMLRRTATDRGVSQTLVDAVEQVAQGHDFWQHQADGMAILSGREGTFVRRLGTPLRPEVAVGRPRLRPLLRHLSDVTLFHVLALSTGQVRLFEASAHSIRELSLGRVPATYDEVQGDRDAQPSLQWSSQGGDAVSFHGHGGDAAAERTRAEKFFRVVSQELRGHLAGDDASAGPLVLACVPENLALFRAAGGHPRLLEDVCVPGNADRTSPAELHRKAWPLVAAGLGQQQRDAAARAQGLAGTGLVVTELEEVLTAAWDGRVEWLFVADDPRPVHEEQAVTDPVDVVLARVLAGGGQCTAPPEGLTLDADLVALLRW